MIYTNYNDYHILQAASQVILIKHSMILTRHIYAIGTFPSFLYTLY